MGKSTLTKKRFAVIAIVLALLVGVFVLRQIAPPTGLIPLPNEEEIVPIDVDLMVDPAIDLDDPINMEVDDIGEIESGDEIIPNDSFQDFLDWLQNLFSF